MQGERRERTFVDDMARVTLPLGSCPCRPALTGTHSLSRRTTTCDCQHSIAEVWIAERDYRNQQLQHKLWSTWGRSETPWPCRFRAHWSMPWRRAARFCRRCALTAPSRALAWFTMRASSAWMQRRTAANSSASGGSTGSSSCCRTGHSVVAASRRCAACVPQRSGWMPRGYQIS